MKPVGFEAPADYARGPVCGILGVAMVAGISFTESVTLFNQVRIARDPKARLFGRGWQGRTHDWEREAVLDLLGLSWGRWRLNDRTLRHFVLTSDPTWRYMVRTSGHIMTIHGHYCVDQGSPQGCHIDKFWKRRATVTDVWYVRNIGKNTA